MFLVKNLLIGLGSGGVVVGGGYMIYNATRSGDEGSKREEDVDKEQQKQEENGEKGSQSEAPDATSQVPVSGDQQTN